MTEEEARDLTDGVYLVVWLADTSRHSVAAIGHNASGRPWLSPANWVSGYHFDQWVFVRSVRLLARHDGTYATELTGMLLAALLAPADDTVLRALQDCISERIGPPAVAPAGG
jgi:hypothetical protein